MDTIEVFAKDLDALRGYEVHVLLHGHKPGVVTGKEARGRAPGLSERRKVVTEWAARFFGVGTAVLACDASGRRGGVTRFLGWCRDGRPVRFVVGFNAGERL